MKKFLTLFLAVVMVFSLSIPAFAEQSIESKNGSTNQIPVQIKTENTTEASVYKVDVSWELPMFLEITVLGSPEATAMKTK